MRKNCSEIHVISYIFNGMFEGEGVGGGKRRFEFMRENDYFC